jgi:hypothetical protein
MNEILYNTLRKYQLNQLSGDEKRTFEQKLASDPAFAAEVAEYATILAAIQQEGDLQLRARLTQYAQKQMQAENQLSILYTFKARKQAARRRFLYAAAAVFLLLVAGVWFFDLGGSGGLTPQEAFAANYSPKSLSRESRDVKAEPWLKDYESGNYDKVITELNNRLTDPSFKQVSAAHLYIGASKLAQGHPEEALNSLNLVSQNSYDKFAAEWFSAMAMLKMGKKEAAKTIIDDIVQQSGHPFNEQAKKLQKDLE